MLQLKREVTNPRSLLSKLKQNYSITLRPSWQGILFGLVTIGSSTALLFLLNFATFNVNMVYVLVTLFATLWFGLAAGVFTAILAFLCFDYFFFSPHFTFAIDAFQGWMAVFLFLVTALFANQLSGRARINSLQAQKRAEESGTLYELATLVMTRIDQAEMLQSVLMKVCESLEMSSCTLFLRNPAKEGGLDEAIKIENPLRDKPLCPPDIRLVQKAFREREAIYQKREPADSQYLPQDPGEIVGFYGPTGYLPLSTPSHSLGILVLSRGSQAIEDEFSVEEKRLFEIFTKHVALAVEHSRLIRETAQMTALRDSDRLKSALLASVSHELRTPLTSIKTFVQNLLDDEIGWTENDRREFLNMVLHEVERLTRLVSNLLDLSRIEGGALKPAFGWYYLPEIVEKVIARLQNTPLLGSHSIKTKIPLDIPLARLDYLQIDQVLTNLLENAAKYSPAETVISLEVEIKPLDQVSYPQGPAVINPAAVNQVLLVKVLDEGPGIPAEQLEHIFDKFSRLENTVNNNLPGVGIGLTIARGIIEANGGRIWAENRPEGGSVFSFTLPLTSLPQEPENYNLEKAMK